MRAVLLLSVSLKCPCGSQQSPLGPGDVKLRSFLITSYCIGGVSSTLHFGMSSFLGAHSVSKGAYLCTHFSDSEILSSYPFQRSCACKEGELRCWFQGILLMCVETSLRARAPVHFWLLLQTLSSHV